MATPGTSSRAGTVVAATVGLAIAVTVGYVLHTTTKQRSEARALVSVVGDTTGDLRDGLKRASPQVLEKIEGNLRVARTWSNPELAEATEIYLVGAREIMRRRADADRLAQKAAASRAALAAHMNHAGQRNTQWIRAAVELKKRAERDHFDLDVQLKALAELLETLPQAHKRLAPHVQESLLLEEDLRARAWRDVIAEAKRQSAELEKVRAPLALR
jgi:hypothetical protein